MPQVYLRRFSNSREQINVYDKALRRPFLSNIRNIAAERRFYDSQLLEEATGNKQFIERHLSGIEGKYGEFSENFLSSLQSGQFRALRVRHRHFLSTYLVIQMMRTRESLTETQQMAEVAQAIHRKLFTDRGLVPPPDEELLDGKSPSEMARDLQHRSLIDADRIQTMANVLFRHIWLIQKAPRGETLFVSDHPFVKRPYIVDPLRGTDGIGCKGIEIMFPLSPQYILTLYERTHFSWMLPADGTLWQMRCPENVTYFNQFQVHQSNRFVFSNDNNF